MDRAGVLPVSQTTLTTLRHDDLAATSTRPESGETHAGAVLLVTSAAALGGFLFGYDTPVLADAGLFLAYGLYTIFAALALVFVVRAVNETKGRELEGM